jgi:two-component system, chemotaxis family, protein-glutamate methylesterase/glutaminase
MKRVRVLVVDDSPICREELRTLLQADGDIQVVGEAENGEQAVHLVRRLRPQVTTMDVQMPGLGGLEAIAAIMAATPVPILVITGRPATPRQNLAFEAVRRGALDLVEKPAQGDLRAGQSLRRLVRTLADVHVVKHVAGNRKPAGAPAEPAPAVAPSALAPASTPFKVIGIGASAGGPAAIVSVLSRLPRGLSAAVALVQHLPPGFVESFGEYLGQSTPFKVEIVGAKTRLAPGIVYLPQDDRHLVASRPGNLAPGDGPPLHGFRPSVDALFQSLADTFGQRAIGVVLSGMGTDGALGLLRLREAGALTIAQDEPAVFGMPKAAVGAGAAQHVLKVDRIAALLATLAASKASMQPPSRRSR